MATKTKKPTIKQAKAIQHIVNGDSVSMAMRKAGYAPATAKNPMELTNSKTFIQILEKAGITEERLSRVLDEGLDATKPIVMGKESSESFVDVIPDHPTRHKFLETSLRLHGHGKEEVVNNNTIIQPILVKFINGKQN